MFCSLTKFGVIMSEYFLPVSYTHLDVYKRQIVWLTACRVVDVICKISHDIVISSASVTLASTESSALVTQFYWSNRTGVETDKTVWVS